MKTSRIETIAEEGAKVTCASCRACCCKLEVMLMGEDDVPMSLVETDRWGGQVMKRLDDGWCAALDRATMLCRIYAQRPTICRDYQVGGTDCLSERSQLGPVMERRK
jgi:Fe-S-cluster containining protein